MNAVTRTVRLLFLNAATGGCGAAERALRRAGLIFTAKKVKTQSAFAAALEHFNPDLVLAHDGCPGFGGMAVMEMARRHNPHLPVILMTGEVSGETAAALADAGITDLVPRDAPAQLSFAVLRALKDARERRILHQTAVRSSRALKALVRCNEAVAAAVSTEQVLDEACRILTETAGYPAVWTATAAPGDDRRLRLSACRGGDVACLAQPCAGGAPSPASTAVRTGEPKVVQNLAAGRDGAPWREEALKRGLASCAALPLVSEGAVLGALTVYSAAPDAFTADEIWFLDHFASALAYGAGVLRDRAAGYTTAHGGGMAGVTLETLSPYQRRPQTIAALAAAIAREMSLPEEQVRGVFLAGLIHDLGASPLPAELLGKRRNLTPPEFNQLRSHVQAGYEHLRNVDFPWPAAEALLQHHEHWDGSGYPNGLAGEEILIEARLLAAADFIASMPGGLNAALGEIARNSARLYDPAVSGACLALFTKKGFELS